MKEHEREAYLLHSRLPAYLRKLERTRERIEEALKTCNPWAVSYSGGKDSTVLIDLVFAAGYRPLVVWQSYGPIETLPGNIRMVEWVREHYHVDVHEHAALGEIDVFRRVGHYFFEPTTKAEREAVQWWWEQSFGSLDRFMREELTAKGHFWGLRSEESAARRGYVSGHGHLSYVKKQKMWVSTPIHDWTGRDVWSYIVSNGLRYNDIYDHPMFENRERARNDIVFLSGHGAIRHGSFVFWRTYDPNWWAKIEEACPEIRTLT